MPISDLTNTTWVINANPTYPLTSSTYDIEGEYFSSNWGNTSFESITISQNSLELTSPCWNCSDSIYLPGEVECDYCHGTGGDIQGDSSDPCPECGGTGSIECSECGGTGTLSETPGSEAFTITGGTDVTNATLISWLEANATQQSSVNRIGIDLSTLSGWSSVQNGEHSITIKAKAVGYYDSDLSTPVTFRKGPAGYTVSITTGSYADMPYIIYDGDSTSGTEITSISSDSSVHVLIESGYMTVEGAAPVGGTSDHGTCSGGVVFDQWLDSWTARYIVTGNGSVLGMNWGCFVEGTPILLADGTTKPVEDITYDDVLLVWNFYEGKLDSAKPCWIMNERVSPQYKKVTLSNGIVLKLVGTGDKCHRLFNVTKQKMLYANECVGDEVYTLDGVATVLSCEKVNETVKYYNLTTDKYLDCFANRVLTGSRLNNMYNIENMKYTDDIRLISEEEEAERWKVREEINGGAKWAK